MMDAPKSVSRATLAAAALLLPLAAHAQTLTTLFSFTAAAADGALPFAGLIYKDGALYGTTYVGGTSNAGTVFTVNKTTGAETVLYSFTGGADGEDPEAGLILHDRTLYGTTVVGGVSNAGTVFTVNKTTGAETVLYSFTGGADGGEPRAGLIYNNGALYGTTRVGGASNAGTVFTVNKTTGAETVLHSFTGGADGGDPEAGLILHDRTLYGTTTAGGASNGGTVFSLTP